MVKLSNYHELKSESYFNRSSQPGPPQLELPPLQHRPSAVSRSASFDPNPIDADAPNTVAAWV
jgi:hypothetical protein